MCLRDRLCSAFRRQHGWSEADSLELVSRLFEDIPPILQADSAACKISMGILEGGRRQVSIIQVSSEQEIDSGNTVSWIAKVPHHANEPGRSQKAGELSLGPRVLYSSSLLIVEEFLDAQHIWSHAASEYADEPDALGGCMLGQFLRMLKNGIVHAFDAINQHTYLLGTPIDPDLRWIDWGRDCSLRAWGENSPDWRTTDHFSALVELLLPLANGPSIFAAMRLAAKELIPDDTIFATSLLRQTRQDLIDPKRYSPSGRQVFPLKWKRFFAACDSELGT